MYYLQLLINGLVGGGVYALFAVGLTMIYSVFGFINFAHGELIAWGAYAILLFTAPPLGLPIWAAALPALALVVCLALAQDKFVFAPLRKSQPVTLLIASIGLSFLLRSLLQLIFGSDLRSYESGYYGIAEWGEILITHVQLGMIGLAVVFLGGLYLLLTRTLLGKSLRAVSDNLELAGLYGVDLKKVSRTVWILSAVFAGSGGILLGLDTSLDPMMGLTNMLKGFAAVLLGGAGNVWGALLGGIFIGVVENLGTAFFSPGYKDFTAFAMIILLLLFRPQGIFALGRGGIR
jgi:branched-chain amino acid transport system permease protein/neutral amino acid transport system permease protein